MILEIVIFALIGVLAGFFAGLFGIAGGIFTIPSLFYSLKYLHVFDSGIMHIAIGTSLAAMIFSTLSAFLAHTKRGAVNYKIAGYMVIGIVFGSALGAYISKILSSVLLQLIFGVFLLYIGIRFCVSKAKVKETPLSPKPFILTIMGFLISSLASLLGIGGGLFAVPYLTFLGFKMPKAIGTASFLSFVVTCLGAIYYSLYGLTATQGKYLVGFIYLPAFIVISLLALCFAPLGVKLAHSASTKSLKKIFGVVLLLIGLLMIYQGRSIFL